MLLTVQEIKSDWIEIDENDDSHDASIERYIRQASAVINGFCRQPIDEVLSKEILFDGCTGHTWYSTGYTVPIEIVSLQYRELPTDSWTTATGAVVHKGRIYYDQGFVYPQYRLLLNAGYKSGIVSEVIKTASGSGYTSSTSVATTTAGDGTGCTLTTTASAGALTALTVSAGGRNYKTGDDLAIAGGTNGTARVETVTSNVPYDVQQATAILVSAAFKKSDKNTKGGTIGVGSTSTSEGGVTKTVTIKDVTSEVQELLSPYKVWFF